MRRRQEQTVGERHLVIEAAARAMAAKAYGSDRWGGKLDPSIMAYWRGQAQIAFDIYQFHQV
jgi:hypothetical protein